MDTCIFNARTWLADEHTVLCHPHWPICCGSDSSSCCSPKAATLTARLVHEWFCVCATISENVYLSAKMSLEFSQAQFPGALWPSSTFVDGYTDHVAIWKTPSGEAEVFNEHKLFYPKSSQKKSLPWYTNKWTSRSETTSNIATRQCLFSEGSQERHNSE